MAYASRAGRARTNARSPEAHAICDRCGFRYNHVDLKYQYDWNGTKLQNLRILVCDRCYDTPQEQARSIFIPADPLPIINPRPEFYVADEGPQGVTYSPTGYPNELLFLCQLSSIGALPNLPRTPPAGGGLYWVDTANPYSANGVAGVLCVTAGGRYPLPTTVPLTSGTYWSDGGVVSVTPGGSYTTVVPASMPLYPNRLWINGGIFCVS
jgi:hypothetical protein